MTTEFNLSEKIVEPCDWYVDAISVEDVKEFIRLLKGFLIHKSTYTMGWTILEQEAYSKGLNDEKMFLLERINKLVGDALI